MWASFKAVGKFLSRHRLIRLVSYSCEIYEIAQRLSVHLTAWLSFPLHPSNSFRTTFRLLVPRSRQGLNAVGLCCSLTHPLSRLGFTFPFGRSNVVRSARSAVHPSFARSVRFGFLRVLCVCSGLQPILSRRAATLHD